MANRLTKLVVEENTLCRSGANPGARVALFKRGDVVLNPKAKKADDPKNFAYVPDTKTPSTWKLDISDAKHVGAAVAALSGKGFRGNRVIIPGDALAGVKAKVRAAWKKFNPDAAPGDVPAVLKAYDDAGAPLVADDEAGETEPSTFSEEMLEQRACDVYSDVSEYVGALMDAVRSAMEHAAPADVRTYVEQALADFGDAVVGSVDEWTGDLTAPAGVGKVGAKISADRLNRLKGAHQALGAMINEQDKSYHPGGVAPSTKETNNMPTPEEIKAAADAEAKKKKDAEAAAAAGGDAAMKSLSPELRDSIKKMFDDGVAAATAPIQKALDVEREERVKLEKALETERETRANIEIRATVEKDLVGYPGTLEEKIEMVKAIRKSLPADVAEKQIEGMKKSAATIRNSPVFKEIGSDAGGGAAGSPEQQLDALAKARVDEVRKSGKAIDFAHAYTAVCNESPGRELYAQYIADRRN